MSKVHAAIKLVEASISPTEAARQLGIGRSTLYREMRRLGVERPICMSRSKSANDLSGLMNYADRAPRDEDLAVMLSAHVDRASAAPRLERYDYLLICAAHCHSPHMGIAFEKLL